MFDRNQINYFERPEREKEVADNLDRFDGDIYAAKYLTNIVNPEFIKLIKKNILRDKPRIGLSNNVVELKRKIKTKDLV